MNGKHQVEIFSAGCPMWKKTIKPARENVRLSREVAVFDGKRTSRCGGHGPDPAVLHATGPGQGS